MAEVHARNSRMVTERAAAKQRLDELRYPELTKSVRAQLLDKPLLCLVAVTQSSRHKTRQREALTEYVDHLRGALKVLRRGYFPDRGHPINEHRNDRHLVDCDFLHESRILEVMLQHARADLAVLQPIKVRQNARSAPTTGKRAAIRSIVPILAAAGIGPSTSPESKFYIVARAVCGSASPATIRAAVDWQ